MDRLPPRERGVRLSSSSSHGPTPGLAAAKSKPLLETLHAYLDSDLSVPATAARLSMHPNTVRYRLEKIEKVTNLNTRNFWDLAELAAAAKILARHPPP